MKEIHTVRLATCVVIMLALTGVQSVLAQLITYVDATTANTSGDTFTASSNTDNHWYFRSGVDVNDDNVFQSVDENAPEITTTASVANGDYYVYAFFWGAGSNWDGAAGLTSGALTDISGNTALSASTLTFNVDPVFTYSTVRLFYFYLGVVTVSDGTLKVYIDDSTIGGGADHRTWYDGIGYAPVTGTYEPGTLFRIDLQASDSEPNQSTQTGWTGWDTIATGPASLSKDLFGIGVTIKATGDGGYLAARGGSTTERSTTITGTSWDNMVEDLWCARDGDKNMEVALTGLTPQGVYRLTGWHNDSYTKSTSEGFAAPVGFAITPSVTTGSHVGVANAGASSNVENGERADSDFNTSVISFVPDGTGAATILLAAPGADVGTLLSGLQLEFIPSGTLITIQ